MPLPRRTARLHVDEDVSRPPSLRTRASVPHVVGWLGASSFSCTHELARTRAHARTDMPSADSARTEVSCFADSEALLASLLFSACSASLLMLNKLIMASVPLPSFVSTLQFSCATATAAALMGSGRVPSDPFVWSKVRPYLLYVCLFVTTIYCNFKALEFSNIETLIVFRACVPCVVALLEVAFLGRQLPSRRSAAAMLVMGGGASAYVASDAAFALDGWGAYTWAMLYFAVVSVEMAYGKYIVGPHLGFATMWGPTLYTNTISIPPMIAIGLLSGEAAAFRATRWSARSIALIGASCVVGVAISYFGFRARSLVTATCFTVLGVANKLLTVLANALLLPEKRASAFGVGCLMVCLLGAATYKQAPMRAGQARPLVDAAPAAADALELGTAEEKPPGTRAAAEAEAEAGERAEAAAGEAGVEARPGDVDDVEEARRRKRRGAEQIPTNDEEDINMC